MNLWSRLKQYFARTELPDHLRLGALGERAAQSHLQQLGLKFLTANFRFSFAETGLTFLQCMEL